MAHLVPIDEWTLRKKDRLTVALVEFESRWRFDARVYFRDENGILQPGKGLALPVDHLARFSEATAKALRGVRARGLLVERVSLVPAGDPE